MDISEKFSIFHVNLPYKSVGCGPARDGRDAQGPGRRQGGEISRRAQGVFSTAAMFSAMFSTGRRLGRVERREGCSGRAPVESSSSQGPLISPTPSRGPRRERHSESAGESTVGVRTPSADDVAFAPTLLELPPPAPPPPAAPRNRVPPPLDISSRPFTRPQARTAARTPDCCRREIFTASTAARVGNF